MCSEFEVATQRRTQVTVRWPRGRDIQASASVLPVAIDVACVWRGGVVVSGVAVGSYNRKVEERNLCGVTLYLQAACGQLAADQV